MAVEKNLFKYEFAVVSIVKDAAEKVKEWIEYHMFAGVDHFYIYDNDSYDNLKDILQPYIKSQLVTYIFYPGKNQRIAAYNEAIENFKFESRYMTFLDVSEFLLPRKNQTVVEVADEILGGKDNVGGFEMHRFNYSEGSQGEGGVLEKFTRRERKPFEIANTIVNPRKVDYLFNVRYATYFDGVLRVNEYSGKVNADSEETVLDKIIVNGYKPIVEKPKTKTEDNLDTTKSMLESFYRIKLFDDSILKYRGVRSDYFINNYDEITQKLSKHLDNKRILGVVAKTLLPLSAFEEINAAEFFKSKENQLKYFRAISEYYVNAPNEFFQNKMETFLTCFNIALNLQKTLLDETAGRFLVDATLNAICQTLCTEITPADARLFLRELPKILLLPYQTVEVLLGICAGMLDKMKESLKNSSEERKNYDIDEKEMETWRKIAELDYLQKLIKLLNVPKNEV